MNTKITGKNIEITGAMREYIEKRLERLEKFSTEHTEINVTCSVEREDQIVEIQVNNGKDYIRVDERNSDLYASVDLALDKAERQLRKEKEKRIEKNQSGSNKNEFAAELTPNVDSNADGITNTVYYDIKPLSIEDAIAKLSATDDLFMPFVNIENSSVNVIYKRTNGTFGIVVPE